MEYEVKDFFKKHVFDIIAAIVFFVGVALVVYPTFSDWHNSKVQTKAVAEYKERTENTPDNELEDMMAAAIQYNEAVYASQRGTGSAPSEDSYNAVLNSEDNGIMGYLEIPTIDLEYPIYHGTSDDVLQIAVGHSKDSSLPVGGENTHALLLGHRGLPSARLFNDLDQLVVGDYFEIHVLGETLYYEVVDISIVLPTELSKIHIETGEDLVTLCTCTPYGVNSHRLLIRGKRMDAPSTVNLLIHSEALRISPSYVAFILGIFLWVVVIILLIITGAHLRSRRISKEEQERRRKILSKYLR